MGHVGDDNEIICLIYKNSFKKTFFTSTIFLRKFNVWDFVTVLSHLLLPSGRCHHTDAHKHWTPPFRHTSPGQSFLVYNITFYHPTVNTNRV